MRLLNIGYDGLIQKSKVIMIMPIGSSGAKRLKEEAKVAKRLIDATQGHKSRTLILMNGDYVVLSAVASETLDKRNTKDNKKETSYG